MATITTVNEWTGESIGYESFEVFSGMVQLLLGDTWLTKGLLPFYTCVYCSHIFPCACTLQLLWRSCVYFVVKLEWRWFLLDSEYLCPAVKESVYFANPQGLPIWSYSSVIIFLCRLCRKCLNHLTALSNACIYLAAERLVLFHIALGKNR